MNAARFCVVAAHPDDETIGASTLLTDPCTFVVHVTDGAPRNRALWSPRAPAEREAYAALRAREAERALGLAGVAAVRARSLGFVDLECVAQLVELTRAIARILRELRPAAVVVQPYEGGHPDHDACAFAVHAAVALQQRQTGCATAIVEMTSYHRWEGALRTGAFLPQTGVRAETVNPLGRGQRALKRSMLGCFESQREVLAPFRVEEERFRAAPRYDFTRRPHAGALHYEGLGWAIRGDQFCAAAERALGQLGLRPEGPPRSSKGAEVPCV